MIPGSRPAKLGKNSGNVQNQRKRYPQSHVWLVVRNRIKIGCTSPPFVSIVYIFPAESAWFSRQAVRLLLNFCPFRGFCVDEGKKVCVRAYEKNSEFYRGALAVLTFWVSEVKEAHRISSDFVKNDDCEGGSLFKRSPKMSLFDENEC